MAGGGRGISWGPGKRDKREQAMTHGLFSQHTNWASHLLGPPLCSSCHTPQLSKNKPAHIPLERGGACVGSWLQLGVRWVMGGEGGGRRKPRQGYCVAVCDSITLTSKCRKAHQPVQDLSNPCRGYGLSEGCKLTSRTCTCSHP